MKNLRNLCLAIVFMLSLSTNALAGDISTPIAPPQSTPPALMAEGQISTGTQSPDSIVDIALSLVQSVLSLF